MASELQAFLFMNDCDVECGRLVWGTSFLPHMKYSFQLVPSRPEDKIPFKEEGISVQPEHVASSYVSLT